MAAALGMILGAGMNALGGYATEKTRQKQEHDQLLFQMYATHPEAAGDPEAQKFLKKHLGPEGAELFGHISEASKKASEQFGTAFGGGGAQPAASPGVQVAMAGKGGPGIAPPSQGQQPDALGAMQQRISRMEAYMASPAFQQLQPDQQKVATDIYNRTVQELTRLTSIQNEQLRSSPEAAAARTTASTRARIAAETEPGAVKAEQERAAGKSGAEARARLAVEGSPEAMDIAKRKHDITAGGKAGGVEAERNKRIQNVAKLGAEWDKNHPYKSHLPFTDSETERNKYISDRLGGMDPQQYINAAGASAAPTTTDDPVSATADKYFPKK